MRYRFFHSESFKLVAAFTVLFTAAMSVVTALVYFSIDEGFRTEALESANGDLGAIRSGYLTKGKAEAIEVVEQHMAGGFGYYLLQDDGQKIAGNLPVMTPRVKIRRLKNILGVDYSILGRGIDLGQGIYAYAGRDFSEIERNEHQVLVEMASIFGITAVLIALGGIIFSRIFLHRMDSINNTCRAIIEGRLADRVPVRGTNDELDRLATTINVMLDRIGTSIEHLRQISTDIAHDLRTPLTRLRHRLEFADEDIKSPEEYKTVVHGALAETETILSLFSALLRIAQIESGTRRAGFIQIDLKKLLIHLAEVYGPVAEDGGHLFQTSFQGEAIIKGDRELLLQMLTNLIENAINHTPATTPISLSLESTPVGPLVRVADKGPGVPADQRSKLFGRFFRLDESRTTPGYGLGLALVRAIADLHGAKVTLADNKPGLICEIQFAEHVE